MPPDQQAIADLLRLDSTYPREPFLDRPRRPNGYRNTPEYREWQKAVAGHEAELARWYQAHLAVDASEPDGLRLRLAGRPVTGSQFRQLPDGSVQMDRPFARIIYPHLQSSIPGWTRPLEMPGPRQNIDAFLEANDRRQDITRRWNLTEAIRRTARRLTGPDRDLPGLTLCPVQEQIHELTRQFVMNLNSRLDPDRFRLLAKLQGGPPPRPWTLLDYNLAVHSGAALAAAAADHPGVVAAWLHWWTENVLYPLPYAGTMTLCYRKDRLCDPPQFPKTPEEIIAVIKGHFDRDSRGRGWSSLAGQPADHIRRQLRRQLNRNQSPQDGPSNWNIALWLAERLERAFPEGSAAAEPESPEPAGEPLLQFRLLPADPAGDNAAADSSGIVPAPLSPGKPDRKGRPASPKPLQPPAELKLLLTDLRFSRNAPGARREQQRRVMGMYPRGPMAQPPVNGWNLPAKDQALDHLAVLALRHCAGRSLPARSAQLNHAAVELEAMADYCWFRPNLALTRADYPELLQAARHWRDSWPGHGYAGSVEQTANSGFFP